MISKFQVGMRYKGWSSAARYGSKAHDIVVVEIDPDRTYLMAYDPDDPEHKTEKYKIKTSEYNEKVSTHPSAYTYFAWRGDKAVGKVDLSKETWVSGQKTRRAAGVAKANKTRSDKALLKAIAKSITFDKFLEIFAELQKNTYLKYWKDSTNPQYRKWYDELTSVEYWREEYEKYGDRFVVNPPYKIISSSFDREHNQYCVDAFFTLDYGPGEGPEGRDHRATHPAHYVYEIVFFTDKCGTDDNNMLTGEDFLKYFGDIVV